MIKSYKEAEEFLYSLIQPTVFHRIEADEHLIDPLERMRVLLKYLDNPHTAYPSIHISGTSGKGSTSYFISKILEEAGYKTGLTISPHLEKVTERIQIGNIPITENEFMFLMQEIEPIVQKMSKDKIGKPSYFEVVIACAFLMFQKTNIDIAVVEVGLEGKYDATNVLKPLVGVLTNISLDHTAILGSTVEQIASEAVSFITDGMHLVTGVTQPTLQRIISDTAVNRNATVSYLYKDFNFEIISSSSNGSVFSWFEGKTRADNIELQLPGLFQVENAALAIEAVSKLTDFVVSGENVRVALANSFFPGRFEKINDSIILDGAHNVAKMQGFITSLERYYPGVKKRFIISFKKQKEVENMLKIISSTADEIIITAFTSATDTEYLASIEPIEIKKVLDLIQYNKKVSIIGSVEKALNVAEDTNKEGEITVITGSLYLVGEARKILLGNY